MTNKLLTGATCASNGECTGADQVCDVGNTNQCACGTGFYDDNGSCVAGIVNLDNIWFTCSYSSLTVNPNVFKLFLLYLEKSL